MLNPQKCSLALSGSCSCLLLFSALPAFVLVAGDCSGAAQRCQLRASAASSEAGQVVHSNSTQHLAQFLGRMCHR